jgi:hypothetical protein
MQQPTPNPTPEEPLPTAKKVRRQKLSNGGLRAKYI